MTKLFAKLRSLLLVFWRKPEPEPSELLKRTVPERRAREHEGTMFYLGDLLNELDEYFCILSKMRKKDETAYQFVSTYGAQVSNRDRLYNAGPLQPYWRKNTKMRPGQGAVYWGLHSEQDEDMLCISLAYFMKLERPVGVQCGHGGDVYQIICLYSSKDKKFNEAIVGFYVSVSSSGEVQLLKELQTTSQRISRNQVIPQRRWAYPHGICWVATGHKDSPEELASWIFRTTMNAYDNSRQGIQVRAKRGRRCGTFSIDMLRTPYFFKDREKSVNENGRTRKIFHIVRSHLRKGRVIRTHFRGLRRFQWNGYAVTISVPGYHHVDWKSAPLTAQHFDDYKPPGSMDYGELGEFVAQDSERHVPWWKEREAGHVRHH